MLSNAIGNVDAIFTLRQEWVCECLLGKQSQNGMLCDCLKMFYINAMNLYYCVFYIYIYLYLFIMFFIYTIHSIDGFCVSKSRAVKRDVAVRWRRERATCFTAGRNQSLTARALNRPHRSVPRTLTDWQPAVWRVGGAGAHLHVLVLFPELHEVVVGLDGLRELSHVDAHREEVLPDLPVLVVTLQSFLERTERLRPERETERDGERQRPREGSDRKVNKTLKQEMHGLLCQ